MGGRRRWPTGPMRCGNSTPKASVSRPLPGNWVSAAPPCDDSSADLQCRFPTRIWQEIYGYRRLTGMLTVNFPPITPGAPSWQTQVEGAYRMEQFTIDWEHEQVRCPQEKVSS